MRIPLLKTHTDRLRGYSGPVLLPVMDDMSGWPDGEHMAEIKRDRNPGNHRRYFAFIKQSFDMQDHYDNMEIWRKVLQLKAGHYDLAVTEKGKNLYLPRTINWDELDETEFKTLFNEVVNAFIRDYGQDLNELQINSILEF